MRLWTVVGLVLGIAGAGAVQAQDVMKMASATINDAQHEWLMRFEAAVKPRTAERLWTYARVWLRREIRRRP